LSQLHITLKFLGEIPEQRINTIKQALGTIVVSSFPLSFSKLGCFPNERRPRVIWIGIDQGYEELRLLAKEVDQKLSELGFPKEKRRFSPHLTLGRVKRLNPDEKEVVSELLQNFTFQTNTSEEITALVFKKSTLTPKGAIYENLADYDLI
jgi:2'-5' RNA ligase